MIPGCGTRIPRAARCGKKKTKKQKKNPTYKASSSTHTPFLHWAKVLSFSRPGREGDAILQRWCREPLALAPEAPPSPPRARPHTPPSWGTTTSLVSLLPSQMLWARSPSDKFGPDSVELRNISNVPEMLVSTGSKEVSTGSLILHVDPVHPDPVHFQPAHPSSV